MSLSIVSIVSRAVELHYPIIPVLESAAPIADEIVINIDTTPPDDGTWQLVFEKLSLLLVTRQVQGLPLEERMHWGRIIESPWNWGARDAGQELARQTNLAFDACTKDWILYLQADEILHEEDYNHIRWLMTLPEQYRGAEFLRLYFWRDLKTLRSDWTQPLVRLVRRGRGWSVEDAMNCRVDGEVWPVEEGLPRLFHYSRLGEAEDIARRVHTLDGLFHPTENLRPPTEYDWGLRAFDTHAITESPESRPESVLTHYSEIHPKVMIDWLQNQEPAQ